LVQFLVQIIIMICFNSHKILDIKSEVFNFASLSCFSLIMFEIYNADEEYLTSLEKYDYLTDILNS
jgi:hypothetical protein